MTQTATTKNGVYTPRNIKRKRRTKVEIERIREAIFATLSEYHPQTCRGVFYQLTGQGVIEKLESEYKSTVIRLLVQMRDDGIVPWDWIADNTRWQRKPRTFNSLQDALFDAALRYRRSLWQEAEEYIEVWCEKDALAGILMEVTAQWDVPLMVSRGFSSRAYINSAAKAIEQYNRPATIYYFGDHDPSGVKIDPAIERGLRKYAPKADITFKRVTVQPWQIEAWDLPTRPTKASDPRSKNFKGRSVEVDSVPAEMLVRLVEECIVQHVDAELYRRTIDIETAERETLEQIAEQFAGAA